MTPAAWTTFWAVLIATAVAGFALLAIIVALRGIQDVRAMLQHMKTEDPDSDS